MGRIKIRLRDGLSQPVSSFIGSVPGKFKEDGRLLFKGRNEVRLMEFEGWRFAVKRFKRKGMFMQIVNCFRSSKALKSFNNADRLIKLGVPTPRPIACIEVRNVLGGLEDSYYICEYVDMLSIRDGLCEDGDFNREMVRAFACFVALLHDRGVLHHDLNSTNVMYCCHNGKFDFTLIDINRMTFYPFVERLSIHECLLNISRFSSCSEMFHYFVKEYLQIRQWPETLFERAMIVKQKWDETYARRKKMANFFKRKSLRYWDREDNG